MTSSRISFTSRILLTIILQFAAVHHVMANYPAPTNLKQNDPSALATQLFATAKEALTSELQILVSGDIEGSLKGKRLARLYRNAKSEQFRFQVSRRNKLKEFKLDYKEYSAEFTLKDVSINGDHAVLKIAEFVSLKLDIPGGPASTEYSEDHSVEFKYDEGEWKLVKDELCRPPASPTDLDNSFQPAVPLSNPLTNAPKRYRGALRQTNVGGDLKQAGYFINASFGAATTRFAYDRNAAVNYALQWATGGGNPAYYRFGNDCTSFVSQCLYTGGWQMVGFGGGFSRASPSVWYYSCISSVSFRPIASYSWGAAYNFNVFILGADRVTGVQYYQDLNPGDIIFADWDTANHGPHLPDGRVDHAMIVTSVTTDRNIFVSYHSNDTRNRSMIDIAAAEPSANFFGDRVR